MSRSFDQKVESALGFRPNKIQELAGGARRTLVDLDGFRRVVDHWRSVAPEKLPRLQGILPAASENSRLLLNYLFELEGEPNFLSLEVDVPRDRSVPNVSALWPYADWWQEELAVFAGARVENLREKGASPWQQA